MSQGQFNPPKANPLGLAMMSKITFLKPEQHAYHTENKGVAMHQCRNLSAS
jgi:hypothetical protein